MCVDACGSKAAPSAALPERQRLIVHEGRNERSLRHELSHHLVFTKTDTAGEVFCGETSQFANQLAEQVPRVGPGLPPTSPSVSKLTKSQHPLSQYGMMPARGFDHFE
jgi:hypothetical protein